MKTFNQSVKHVKEWHLVDAENKTLGRLATAIAKRLCGKHRPEYTPSVDTGDYIVVINAEKIKVTGNKLKSKMYHRYSGYQSGLKEISLEKQLVKAPTAVLKEAVKGMLPKGQLGRQMLTKLKIYAGENHVHQAQKLTLLNI